MGIKLIKKNNEGVEIKSGARQGDLRYTPTAKSVARKLGDDLLMAILAAASDEAWSQADESEWKDAVDTDHDLEWNTCQALGWGFDDMGEDAPFKGDSGKVYSGDEAKNAYNAIAALSDDDRYSLFFNNQPRNYSHIRDVVATAMDMAADDDDNDDNDDKPGSFEDYVREVRDYLPNYLRATGGGAADKYYNALKSTKIRNYLLNAFKGGVPVATATMIAVELTDL